MELLEIEKELNGSDGQAAVARYDRMLVSLTRRCRAAMDAGMQPADFHKCEALVEAVTVARKLIRLTAKS